MITTYDLENSFNNINSFADELVNFCKDDIPFANSDKADEIVLIIKQLNRVLPYYAKVENRSEDIHFARGRIIGITEVYGNLLTVYQNKNEKAEKCKDIYAAVKSVSHGSEILSRLSTTRGVQHKELSKAIGIDDSTLTGIMDKLIRLRVVDYNKIGKFKFYYLSHTGQEYEQENVRQKNIEELKLQFYRYLKKYINEKNKYYYKMNFIVQKEEPKYVYKQSMKPASKRFDMEMKNLIGIKRRSYMPV